ncbi:hypothetical protein EDD17DRAFT_724099 [Pisolithus thermaeus]|nr:hypothetical protein EDD17DRAFT_724099 [Pisolithus thermaeus]
MKVKSLALGQVRPCLLRPARRTTIAFRTSSWPSLALSTRTPLTSVSRLQATRRRPHSTNSRSSDHHDAHVQNATQSSTSKNDNDNDNCTDGGEQPSRAPYVRTGSVFPISSSTLFDAALTSIVGLGIVFLGGVAYIAWYKKNVLDKVRGLLLVSVRNGPFTAKINVHYCVTRSRRPSMGAMTQFSP